MTPTEYTFGAESEGQTRKKQLAEVQVNVEMVFGPFDESQTPDTKRLDPRDFILSARDQFLQAAKEQGLTPHEALHSWGNGLEVEDVALTEVTASTFCIHQIAQRFGITVEELMRRRAEASQRSVIEMLNGTGRPPAGRLDN